jgi:hypothetical protein
MYTWGDGRNYKGYYQNDKKEGFGVYSWADGRSYRGYWKNGSQHGLGTFVSGKDVQYGIWSEGKRIRWISKEDAKAVDLGKLAPDLLMKDIEKSQNFKYPEKLDAELQEISMKISNLWYENDEQCK